MPRLEEKGLLFQDRRHIFLGRHAGADDFFIDTPSMVEYFYKAFELIGNIVQCAHFNRGSGFQTEDKTPLQRVLCRPLDGENGGQLRSV